MSGHSGLAVGNVLGSSIANAFFILGIAGLISPIERPARLLLPNAIVVVAVAGGVLLLGHQGIIPSRQGLLLLIAYGIVLAVEYSRARTEARLKKLVTAPVPLPSELPSRPVVAVMLVASGLAALYLGADLLVEGAVAQRG